MTGDLMADLTVILLALKSAAWKGVTKVDLTVGLKDEKMVAEMDGKWVEM